MLRKKLLLTLAVVTCMATLNGCGCGLPSEDVGGSVSSSMTGSVQPDGDVTEKGDKGVESDASDVSDTSDASGTSGVSGVSDVTPTPEAGKSDKPAATESPTESPTEKPTQAPSGETKAPDRKSVV